MEPAHTPETRTLPFRPPVRWHNSLYFRVVLLCGVLLVCLLGSVVTISRYYFEEAVSEMEVEAARIADRISVVFDENPEIDLESLERESMRLSAGSDIEFEPYTGNRFQGSITLERDPNGRITRVARVPLLLGDRHVLMTLQVPVEPGVEVMRALRNRNMLALIAVFLLTLSLMVYFIYRALRPLKDLSDSCAAISSGDLRPVGTRRAAGEIRALENTFNDMVTALKEKEMVEAKLRQAQRLSALGNLAAGVAHDVRNPLNAIKLLSSHAIDNLEGAEGTAAARGHLETIRNEVGRLEEIVSSFLSLAKESELKAVSCGVDALLGECVRLIQKDAEARRIRLSAELRASGATLLLDPKQWTRAILNVLLNALEACPPESRVRLFSRVSGATCEIEIRDDGPGMTAEAAERAFEPYFTTKAGGTGLGLSLTRGIIEEHGGRIDLYSVAGHGCQVVISMPIENTKAHES